MKQFYVYILASRYKGTLYVGVTRDLSRRIGEHKGGVVPRFTKEYGVHRLVCVEDCTSAQDAIAREKQLKHWKRDWKIELIERDNLEWRDLSDLIV